MSIIMCHYFHDEKKYKKVQGSIDIKIFENIFTSDFYKVLSIDDYLEKLEKKILKDNEICFSFDDGLKEQYELAVEILNKYNIKGLFNINTNPLVGISDNLEIYRYYRNYCCNTVENFYDKFFSKFAKKIGKEKYSEICDNYDFNQYLKKSKFYTYNDRKFRYIRDEILKEKYLEIMAELLEEVVEKKNFIEELWMNKEELKKIVKDGHILGLHTHTHPTSLDKLTYEMQYEDFQKNKQVLEKIINRKIKICAYPCGKYNENTFKVMKDLKIKYGLAATINEPFENLFLIKRVDISDFIKEIL